MKNFFTTLLISIALFTCNKEAHAQTFLGPGDLAFIGELTESDNATTFDGFTFITLKAISAGTVVYFTDCGWNQTFWTASEGHITWTTTSSLPVGTIVNINFNTVDFSVTTTSGTVTSYVPSGSYLSFPVSGDQILAYQGSGVAAASPTFIAAIDFDYTTTFDGTDGWSVGNSTSNSTYCSLPPGLKNTKNCVSLVNSSHPSEYNNFKYTGTLTGTVDQIRAAINNRANWTGNDGGAISISSGYATVSITTSPTTLTVNSTAGGLSAAITAAGGDLNTIKNLTITGTIDATDFKAMRDNMPLLVVLDLSGVTIAEYTGTGGTAPVITLGVPVSKTYPKDGIPEHAFCEFAKLPNKVQSYSNGKSLIAPIGYKEVIKNITSIKLPRTLTSIGDYAFNDCSSLKTIYVYALNPGSVALGTSVFSLVPAVLHVPFGKIQLYKDANWFYWVVDDSPIVSTTSVSSIGLSSATVNGNITDFGITNPTQYGAVWSTAPNPTVDLTSKTEQGVPSAPGLFTTPMADLTTNTKYYVRAYATNSIGTSYGEEKTFTTLSVPTITKFTPTSGGNGTIITIEGADLTGATAVTFGDTPAKSFTADLDTKISAVVGTGKTGTVKVTTPGGEATSSIEFTYVPNITLSSSTGGSLSLDLTFYSAAPFFIDWGNGTLTVQNGTTTKTTFSTNSYVANQVVKIYAYPITGLDIDSRNLTSLDISKCTELTHLNCNLNKLTTLDLSKNTELISLDCQANKLTALNVNSNTKLWWLNCADNLLSALDVSINTLVTDFYCQGNKLKFSTLPQPKSSYTTYSYAPQANVAATITTGIVGLISQLTAKAADNSIKTTIYKWYTKTAGTALIANTDYTEANGVFTFKNAPADSIYCSMTNEAFPGSNPLRTVNVKVELAPKATTSEASDLTSATATLNGTITANNASTTVTFEYGTTTAYGTSVSATISTVTGATNTVVSAGIIDLLPNTTYHYRVKGVNSEGTTYGADMTFITLEATPTIFSFLPVSAGTGMTVTITGTNFTGTTSVSFGATAVSSFTVNSDTQITANISTGTTGSVSVTTPKGSIEKTGFTWIPKIVLTAGGLSALLTTDQKTNLTELTITGTIDARDFKTMRDNMPKLATLDLSGVSISAYTGTEGTAGTTSTVYPANGIPQNAFYNPTTGYGKNSLITMKMPTTVTTIGNYAFLNCYYLNATAVSGLVTSIGLQAFGNCKSLINVDASNPNYSSIDGVLFNKNKTTLIQCPISITGTFTFPNTVTAISDYAFQFCKISGALNFPPSLVSIGKFSFAQCPLLTGTFNFPTTLKYIYQDAFNGCSGFTGDLYIPSSVIYIGESAFNSCSKLDGNLTISPSITIIETATFSNCSKLKGNLIIPTNVTSIGYNAFYNCAGFNGTLTLPDKLRTIYQTAFYNCSRLTGEINIPSLTTFIYNNAFEKCSSFTGPLTIPSLVTYIGPRAFKNCSALTSIISKLSTPTDLEIATRPEVFLGINKTTCKLSVPTGSFLSYSNAVQWKDFFSIATPIPTSLSGFTTPSGTASVSQTFNIGTSATLLDLTVNAPAGFEVRENNTGSFGASVVFTSATGGIPTKTIEVRIAASASSGTPSGDVVCSSTGASNQNVAVSGTVNNPPSITSFTPTSGVNGTIVTITGTNLTSATAVTFGTASATGVTVDSDTQITATAPAGLGTVDVTITTIGGTSNAKQFTYAVAPTVTTQAVYAITANTATCSGNITSLGSHNPTAYGVCWKSTGTPTILDSKTDKGGISSTGAFTAAMAGLSPNTTYYVRAYATNVAGTNYGEVKTIVTKSLVPAINYNITARTYTVGTGITALEPQNTGGTVPAKVPGTVTTFAGNLTFGNTNAAGTSASFLNPNGLAIDNYRNIYVADMQNRLIRKITPDAIVTTFAGSGAWDSNDGLGTAAGFRGPGDVELDNLGNLYVTDMYNNKVRKITSDGNVSTLTSGINKPSGSAIDGSGNIYVAQYEDNVIRKITPEGTVTIFAGSSTAGYLDRNGTEARFNKPYSIALDASGNMFVADMGNNRIRKITTDGTVSTFAGSGVAGSLDGSGVDARFDTPSAITIDGTGNMYVSDGNRRIRRITPEGYVTTLAGNNNIGSADGIGNSASFNYPEGSASDGYGNLFVADYYNHEIRKISLEGYSIYPSLPAGLTFDATTGKISGTPTRAISTTTFTILGENSGGISKTTIDIEVLPIAPQVSTFDAISVSTNAAVLRGDVTNDGGTVATTRGFVLSATDATPTIGEAGVVQYDSGAGNRNYSFQVKSLSPNTTYYCQSYATNTANTSYGGVKTIKTNSIPNISYTNLNKIPVGKSITAVTPVNSGGVVPATVPGVITLAGSTTLGNSDGSGTAASFNYPMGVSVDYLGNVYVADAKNHSIRKISSDGVVTTIAGSLSSGSENGNGTAATFNFPKGLTVDAFGNLYVVEASNLIRKIAPNGDVTTFAGNSLITGLENGIGTSASFNTPWGISVDGFGSLYIAETNAIRKVTSEAIVTTHAGAENSGSVDGNSTDARFYWPKGTATDTEGNVYVADELNNMIRKITPTGVVSTLAGTTTSGATDGVGASASFKKPSGVATDFSGNIYVTDFDNNMIRKITPAGVVTTIAGSTTAGLTNEIGSKAKFNNPAGIAVDTDANLYIADSENNTIRKIIQSGYTISPSLPVGLAFDATTGIITGKPMEITTEKTYTITATNGYGTTSTTIKIEVARDAAPIISYSSATQTFIKDKTITNLSPVNTGGAIPAVTPGVVTTYAGNTTSGETDAIGSAASFKSPTGVTTDAFGNVYVADSENDRIRKINTGQGVSTYVCNPGYTNVVADIYANLWKPNDLTFDASGNIYIADLQNNKIQKVATDNAISILAGNGFGYVNGVGSIAKFKNPAGVATDKLGNVYVADVQNHRIRMINTAGVVSTFAGSKAGNSNNTGESAQFNTPTSIAIDALDNIYVADQLNNVIRKITPAGVVSTFAENMNNPKGVAVDAQNNVYVADMNNNMIRKITPDGIVSTLAGNTTAGSADGAGEVASFNAPYDVAADAFGNVYVADNANNMIRKISQEGYSISPALPAGLNFDPKTGIISGTPTDMNAEKTYTITGINNGGVSTTTLKITVACAPTVSTISVSSISTNSVVANGEISDLGVPNPTQHGFVWSKSTEPKIETSDKSELGEISSADKFKKTISSLTANTKYYLRAYATNIAGTSYGAEVDFITNDIAPNISYSSPQKYLLGAAITTLTPTNTGGAAALPGTVSWFAGNGEADLVDGDVASASFNMPIGIAFDATGNMYVSDSENKTVRKISTSGIVSTLVDNTTPIIDLGGIVTDVSGNIYFTDRLKRVIRKITPSGEISIFAGVENGIGFGTDTDNGYRTSAKFNQPFGLTIDANGNMYVTDFMNTNVRKIATSGEVTTIAGSGNFDTPYGIAVDKAGNVYVADAGKNKIVRIKPTGEIADFAGNGSVGNTDGPAGTAQFNMPVDLTVDNAGNLYVADAGNNLIRKITSAGEVSTVAAQNPAEKFNQLFGLALDASGNLYVADMGGNIIRKVILNSYSIKPALPTGLNFNNSTGSITGTPTSLSAATTYEITASNTGGSSTASISIAVVKASVVSTKAVTNFTRYTATGNGEITDLGFPNPTQHGVVWSTSVNPTVSLSTKTEEGTKSSTGTFTSSITGLAANTLYYVRAYAINAAGISYGEEKSFTTLANYSYTISSPTATTIKLSTATLGATIAPVNAPVIDRGICWTTTSGVTIANNKTSAGGTTGGTFTVNVSSLTKSKTIYYRGYVVNQDNETILSDEASFSNVPVFTGTGDWNDVDRWNVKEVPLTGFSSSPVIDGICTISNSPVDGVECRNLTINSGAKLTINPAQTLKVGGTIINNEGEYGLVIKASSTLPNATFAYLNGTPSATVEMYSKASWDLTKPSGSRFNWQYFGIPVQTLAYSPVFDNSIVRRYNAVAADDANLWKMETADSILTSGTGYEITQEATKLYSFKGLLTNADFARTLPNAIGAKYKGQHIFGNPFTAAVNINEISYGANTEQSVYLYNTGTYNDWKTDATSLGNAPGQYTVSTKLTAGNAGIPAQIPSMQGFLMKTTNETSGSFAFGLVVGLDNNREMQRAPSSKAADEKVITRIDVVSAHAADRMWIFTEPTCTRNFDNGWDGYKMMGSVVNPQLFAMEADGNYQINAVPTINETYLGFQAGQDTEYTLKFTQLNVASAYNKLYLMDLEEGYIVDITADGSEYSFKASLTPQPVKRFKIVTNAGFTTSNTGIGNDQLKVFNSNETIYIENLSDQKGTLTLYDLKGIVLKIVPYDANKVTYISTRGIIPGAYLAKAGNGKEQVTAKIIIR